MSETADPTASRAHALPFAGPALIALAFAVLCAWSFGTWPDPLVDFGRELYAPWRLAEGERLYTDVAWFNGPLSVWTNALLFRVFGVAFETLVFANLALLALVTALVYRVLARASDRLAATTACLVLLGVFAFGQYGAIGNYNFVAPYSHELTHGFALSLAALACVDRACRRRAVGWFCASGICLGLAFLTKPEVFLAGCAAVLVRLACFLGTSAAKGKRLVFTGVLLVSATLPLDLAFVRLALEMDTTGAVRGVLGSWPHLMSEELRALPFYRAGMGLDRPAENVDALLRWSLGYACLFGLPALLAWFLPRGRGAFQTAVAPLAAFAVVAGLLAQNADRIDWPGVARPLPLATLLLFTGTFVRWFRSRNGEAGEVSALRLALAVFAGVSLAKLGLNARVIHYGFVLALPATLLFVVAVTGWLPATLSARGKSGNFARAAALGALAVCVGAHIAKSEEWFERKLHTVGEDRDAFKAATRGGYAWDAVLEIRKRLAPEETLLVLPEGVMLNYLARRANPTPFVNFMPPELILFGEDRILAALADRPPDLVALVHKDTSEYGYRWFGRDYGLKLGAWLTENYREVHRIADAPIVSGRFGIALFERN